jgi:sulfotransferase famil protein
MEGNNAAIAAADYVSPALSPVRRVPMIISHKHHFIFFAMPKTATHAIREALREHMGPEDWEQQMLFGRDALPIPQLAAIRHGHISVQQLKPHLPQDQWRDYFKFAFVRNPYDRFISTYFFLNRNQDTGGRDEGPLMKAAIQNDQFRARILVAPQHRLITHHDGSIAVDYVAKYEDIQTAYEHICTRVGIPPKTLIEKNTSQHKTFDTYYDSELRALVTDFYRTDFELLGYDVIN